MATKIMKCVCKSEYQDRKYGESLRVMNMRKDKGYRCTVCGKDKVL